ncbi:MAG: tetratricopeptide repeat protein, partial [Bradyrhizobium sp.]
DVVGHAYQLTGAAAAQALVRIVQDFAYSLEDPGATDEERSTGRQIMRWLLALAERIDDPEQLAPLVFALPDQTTILRESAAELTQKLADHFLGKAQANDDLLAVIFAGALLNNLANRLGDLGRREDALRAAEEAVGLRRALAAARPDAFIPDLARSLNNLANRLSNLGRREDALRTAEEAVGLYRALAAARPDAFIPGLARSLNNLANRLSDLGRREDALRTAEEAVSLRRALAAARPDAFGVELARSLWVLGDLYADNEQPDLAVSTLAEAIKCLTPTFLRVPQAVAEIMAGIEESYLARCEAVGRESDMELLAPVVAAFEKLQNQEGKE